MQADAHGGGAMPAQQLVRDSQSQENRLRGIGMLSITASAIVLTSLPPVAGSSARTDRQNSATSAAAS